MWKYVRDGLVGVGLLALAACSSAPSPGAASNEFDSIATVKIEASDTQAAIEAKYGGKAFVFMPEAGIAVLGFSKEQGKVTTLSTDPNIDALSSPEVSAASYSAWAGGWNAWGGGWNAWAGGWSAWAGGTPIAPPSQNDSLWNQVNLRQAHNIARNFGAGTMVAVIDTGIDTAHPMFSGRLASSSLWRDYVDNDNLPKEGASTGAGYGHGTAVAGMVLQVAPKATILPIRVLDYDGRGDLDDVISAIYHAINSGAKVINLSLGSVEYSSSLLVALQYAKTNAVYVVASAGNAGTLNSTTYPAQNAYWEAVHPFVIGVGSVNSANLLSSFSSYGNGLTANAPGEQNYSAYPDNRVGYFKGTSFAAPLVAGALALGYSDASSTARPQLYMALSNGMYNSSDYWDGNIAKYNQGSIGEGILNIANFMRSIPGWSEPSGKYTTSTNLFSNPGFESTMSTGWWFNNASRGTVRRSGSYGLTVNGWGGASLTVSGLKPSTTYTLIAWGKTTSASDPLQMGVSAFGGTNFNHNFYSTSYTTKSLTFKTGSSNTSANIYFAATAMTGYFDDIRLVEDNL